MLENNPLVKQELPKDIIKLPSKGMFYKTNEKKEPITSLTLEYLTTKDEAVFNNIEMISDGSCWEHVFNRKIVDKKGLEYGDLLRSDQLAFMLAVRINTYGEIYETKVYNPHTKEVEKKEVDLSKIKFNPFTETPDGNGHFSFQLPYTKKNLKIRLLTAKQIDNLKRDAESKKNAQGGVDPYPIDKLEAHIVSIDGNDDRAFIHRYIESREFPPRDALKLRKFIANLEPSVDLMYTFDEDQGDKSFKSAIPLDETFFFPAIGL